MSNIRAAIVGYGNLGKGVEKALQQANDMELVGVYTRREPDCVGASCACHRLDQLMAHRDGIDICLLCGGSATDLMVQGPAIVRHFHTVDAYDTHHRLPEYRRLMRQSAGAGGRTAILSAGWDPGLFSLNRLMMEAVLPTGSSSTFWGPGVSQGHGDALRRVEGVVDAVQYTLPIEAALEAARRGEAGGLSPRQKHRRVCYVTVADGAEQNRILQQIVTMPDYFDEYDTQVHFISLEQLHREHKAMPHAGKVIRQGTTGGECTHQMEYALQLGSNPEFTASVMVAYARAAMRLAREGRHGAFTVFEIPPCYLSMEPLDDLIKRLL